jgi:FAD/FMN-containing dehydrogenase
MIYWNDKDDEQPAYEWIRAFYNSMLPYVSPYAYFNYVDRDVQDWTFAYWSTNYPSLQIIKQKYDPYNIFHYPQGVSP